MDINSMVEFFTGAAVMFVLSNLIAPFIKAKGVENGKQLKEKQDKAISMIKDEAFRNAMVAFMSELKGTMLKNEEKFAASLNAAKMAISAIIPGNIDDVILEVVKIEIQGIYDGYVK